jgi:hypothetical protein
LWRSQDERAADPGYLTVDGDRVILHNSPPTPPKKGGKR